MESFAEVAAAPPPQEAPHISTYEADSGKQYPAGEKYSRENYPSRQVEEPTTTQGNRHGLVKEPPVNSTNMDGKDATGSIPSEDAAGHPDRSGTTHDDASYASALKAGLSNGDEHEGGRLDGEVRYDPDESNRHRQDDEESYPDLDDMGLEEVHRAQKRRTKTGGIRWAPWNVPLRRRAQTFVVLLHCLSIVGTVSLFFALCANPFAWPLLLIYLLHVLTSRAATDGSLKYRWEWFRRNYFWHLFTEYFPAKLHKTCDLPPTRKYIFGYHPHGIISHGAWAAFATDALGFSKKFPGITNSLLTLDSNFRVPIYRDYILAMGVRSVSKESIVNILTRGGSNGEGMGRGVTVVVGGARESLEAQPGHLRLILKGRKGFVKIAVRTGADLVPVLCFGENELYDQLPPNEHPFVHQIQMFVLKVWKFTLPFMHGRGIFNYDVGLMPYRHPLNIVVGAPIKVEQSNSVDQDYIDKLHELYIEELEKLWGRYKDEFAKERKGDLQLIK
ncbi:hypothetical protein DL766_002589 [Monosporascus sp. MC13-8B]|uniref:diacylglycerol O-acyltransferase n=1 Tax=Monosporascus cannonballus TaxID=155416 RepID=A0ABY0HEK0_9PEZI|nr:hypothetical protein DL763_010418 [Monosporascus cannonballus]RYO91666.1 hypothetical protein DL762_002104 [Monosporascus cannonballus]RYP35246.1 hypothetical protein DL766_002589 [Monosporascus sp. MC13-8B]